MSKVKQRDSGPDCVTCQRQGRRGIKAINVVHHTPEQRAELFADQTPIATGGTIGDYWSGYYADIVYHPFQPAEDAAR